MLTLVLVTYFSFNLGAVAADLYSSSVSDKCPYNWMDMLMELLFAFPVLAFVYITSLFD